MLKIRVEPATEITVNSDAPHKPGAVSITGEAESVIRQRLQFAYGLAGHIFELAEQNAPVELWAALISSGFQAEILEGAELTKPDPLPEGAVS